MTTLGWILLSWGIARAQAPCETPATLADLDRTRREAEQFVAEGDSMAYREVAGVAEVQLRCVEEPLTPIHAASYHLVRAFAAFVDGDHAGATSSFQAVLAADPTFALSSEVAPPGHPLAKVLEDARRLDASGTFALEAAYPGALLIDGRRAVEAPSGRPWIFQYVDDAGRVVRTDHLEVGEPVPPYPVRAEEPVVLPVAPAPVPEPEPRRKAPVAAISLVAGGAVVAATGIALYADVRRAANTHYPTLTTADQETYWKETLAPRYYASVALMGLGGVALGSGTVWLVVDGTSVRVRGTW